MQKIESLQEFLDMEIAKITLGPGDQTQKGRFSFDKIQDKLNSLENKLLKLRNADTHRKHYSSNDKFAASQSKHHYDQGNQTADRSANKRISKEEATPQKKLGIVSKTMSVGYLSCIANTASHSKKKYNSVKKISKNTKNNPQIRPQQHLNIISKKTPSKLLKKKMHNTTHTKFTKTKNKDNASPIADLQSEMEACCKANNSLKQKIRILRLYEKEHKEIKRIFNKTEKMRRKKCFQ